LSKKDVSSASASKPKMSATKKKKTAGRMAKLKSSSWYEGAARSLGISKRKPREKTDERID
jgi:hypothetical protein